MRIIVIGGGIIGLMTARELAMAGQSVTLLEQGQIGAEASWAGGGILSPLYPWRYPDSITRLARWSQASFPALAESLITEVGIDPQWQQSGLLFLDTDEYQAAKAWSQANGLDCRLISAQDCQRTEPSLRVPGESALWFPELAQIRNPRIIKALVASCVYHGVTLRHSTPVTGVSLQGSKVSGVKTSQGHLAADAVIVASGAWTSRLLAGLGMQLPVQPVRGQMIMYQAVPDRIQHINLYQSHYLIPRRDGRILVGSTLEQTEFDKSTTEAARSELAEFACGLFPFLSELAIEQQWAGLRPGSPTGIPYICPIPDISGLYLNTGHYRNGLVLSLASARLLADLLLGRAPILDPSPYGLRRE